VFYLELVQNVGLLVFLVIIHGQIIRRWNRYTLASQIFSGFLFGCVALIGMMVPVHLLPGLIFDGRSIVLSVAGLFGGPVTAAIAAIMSAAYRLWLGGPGTIMGVSVIVESAGLGVAFYYLRRRHPEFTRNLYLFGFGLLVHLGMLSLTLTLPREAMLETLEHIATPVLLIYPAATWLICLLFLDQESRVSAEQALRESEERYRAVFNNAAIGIDTLAPDGRISQVNSALSEMLGYTEDELKKLTFEEITHPDDRQISKENLDFLTILERDSYRLEKRYLRKNGEVVWGDLSTSCIKDANGNHVGTIGVIADITKRKRTEELLSMTVQRYHAILSSMYGGVLVASEEGRVDFANQAFCDLFDIQDPPGKLTGLTPPEINQRIKNAFAEPDEAINRIQTLVDRGLPVKGEEITLNDGRTLIRDFIPIFIDGKRYGRLWLHHDITERKRTQESLQAEKEKLRGILHCMNDGVYIANAQNEIEYVNPVIEASFGDVDGRKCYEYFHDRTEPCPWCKNREVFSGESVTWEWYSNKTGKTYELFDTPLRNPDGSISKLEIFHDITERNKAEAALRRSEDFLEQIVENIPNMIFVKDAEWLRFMGVSKN
jgi:PAS domain S-box-containing protein